MNELWWKMIWDNDSGITNDVQSGDRSVEEGGGNRKDSSKSSLVEEEFWFIVPLIDSSTLEWR